MSKKVGIIGGGVSGITTALTLQLLGYETICYAEQWVQRNAPLDPGFSSLFPAASIIPHSLETDRIPVLFPASLCIFKNLCEQPAVPVVMSRHYEVAEFYRRPPAYTSFLSNFSNISPPNQSFVPRRKKATELYGWSFDCFIAECPDYIYQLYNWYRAAGGTMKTQRIERKDISRLPADIIINCSGLGSHKLFHDSATLNIMRGHLIHITKKQPIVDYQSRPCSYSYTPRPSVYATPTGQPCDVYLYPVKGKWVLGGSRQSGSLNKHEKWQGPDTTATVNISKIEVPKAIIDLNREILWHSFNTSFPENLIRMEARLGYRYTREDPKNGLRLEATEAFGKKIIHNYGHGGAGVSLSWGCALNVLRLIQQRATIDLSAHNSFSGLSFLNNLQLRLHEVYLQYFVSNKNHFA